jgi:hypothetical protein
VKRPDVRHDFLSEGDELNYLSDMVGFHLRSGRESSIDMQSSLRRFHELLAHRGLDDGSIMLQDHWALLHEAARSSSRAAAMLFAVVCDSVLGASNQSKDPQCGQGASPGGSVGSMQQG